MNWSVVQGDVLESLSRFPSDSVDCIVTSPPYWGLRDYGVPEAWGLEPTLGEYIERMRSLGKELMRVLKPTGTFWLNLGDAYASGKGTCLNAGGGLDSLQNGRAERYPKDRGSVASLAKDGLKPKDLIGLPWRVAFALQEQGWYLRSDIVWSKPNPMPESVRDRPTRAHEYVFLLTKNKRYWYDADAIRSEPQAWHSQEFTPRSDQRRDYKTPDGWDTSKGEGGHGSVHKNGREKGKKPGKNEAMVDQPGSANRKVVGLNERYDEREANGAYDGKGANARTVWTIATQPYPEAHFATFPQELPKRCILAGCPEGGLVLDPFAGSGTTLEVAVRLGRSAVGIELNESYVKLIEARMQTVTPSLFQQGGGS